MLMAIGLAAAIDLTLPPPRIAALESVFMSM
jgi:hypothetical protein